MKIEIGCGLKPHKGYKTIDVEEYAKPDYLGDFRTMSFENLEEIRSHHLLEHFSREEAIKIIDTWYGWLSLGGKLIIETPDIEGICEQFSKITGKKERYWLCRHLYGSQERDWAFHRDGWWEDKFKDILSSHCFKIISFRKNLSRKYLPNILVIAEKI